MFAVVGHMAHIQDTSPAQVASQGIVRVALSRVVVPVQRGDDFRTGSGNFSHCDQHRMHSNGRSSGSNLTYLLFTKKTLLFIESFS